MQSAHLEKKNPICLIWLNYLSQKNNCKTFKNHLYTFITLPSIDTFNWHNPWQIMIQWGHKVSIHDLTISLFLHLLETVTIFNYACKEINAYFPILPPTLSRMHPEGLHYGNLAQNPALCYLIKAGEKREDKFD